MRSHEYSNSDTAFIVDRIESHSETLSLMLEAIKFLGERMKLMEKSMEGNSNSETNDSCQNTFKFSNPSHTLKLVSLAIADLVTACHADCDSGEIPEVPERMNAAIERLEAIKKSIDERLERWNK